MLQSQICVQIFRTQKTSRILIVIMPFPLASGLKYLDIQNRRGQARPPTDEDWIFPSLLLSLLLSLFGNLLSISSEDAVQTSDPRWSAAHCAAA
ncbi:hypothetical protein H4582DRAFT_2021442 [Lactarius indigo]|nr:hypothetical protein H4582DRAFT_2021442 [Lactarius indigo]